MVVSYAIIGIVLEHVLQSLGGFSGLSFTKLNLPTIDKRVVVTGIAGEDRIRQLAGLVETVFQNEQLNVVLLDLRIFWMIMKNCCVFRDGLIEIAGGEIKVAEHAIAHRIVGKFTLDLLEKCLGIGFLALRNIKTGDTGRRIRIFRIKIHGMA